MDMHIERHGAGQAILFIHGSGCSSAIWHWQKEYLQTSMEVVLIDLPGHGRSPGDGCGSVEEYGDAAYGAMMGSGSTGYYVAGHSLGGAIAMFLALSHPDAVKGIILIGTGARLRVLPRILEGILKEKERTLQDINALSFSKSAPAATREEALKEMAASRPEVIHKDFTACDRFDIMDSVGSIRVPALILCGEDDTLTPVRYSLFLKEKIAGSELTFIKGAGHMVMIEKPDEVNKAIEAFIKDCL